MLMAQWNQIGMLLAPHKVVLGWLVGISAITFFGTLAVVPLLVARLPSDYLNSNHTAVPDRYGIWWWPLQIAKNVLGAMLVVAGLAMLVLPGQGLLTLFIGISLISFPGKRTVLRRLVRQKQIMRAINWLRRKWRVPPLEMPLEAEIANSEQLSKDSGKMNRNTD